MKRPAPADQSVTDKTSRSATWAAAILVAALAVTAYWNTLHNDFAYDDFEFIVDNPAIRDLRNIPAFFTSREYFAASKSFDIIYRPLATTSFALNYRLGGQEPFGYHLVNLIFHALNGVLLYVVLSALFPKRRVALIAALAFVVHPVQTEAVAWVAGRGNVFFLFFFLWSVYFFIQSGAGSNMRFSYLASLLCCALALLSKEMAIVLPLTLMLCDATVPIGDRPRSIQRRVAIYLPFVVVAGLYVLLRQAVLGHMAQRGYWGGGLYATFLTMCKAFVYYVKLLFFPLNLTVDYTQHAVSVSSSILEWHVILSMAILVILVAAAVILWSRFRDVSFAVFWLLIALLPVSNLVPLEAVVAERFLYLPSIGFCILVGVVVEWAIRRSQLSVAGVAAPVARFCVLFLLVFFSLLTIDRNGDWADARTLWSKTLETNPNSATAHNNLGLVLEQEGMLEEAMREYQKAVSLEPTYARSRFNVGFLYYKQGLYDLAIQEYVRTLDLDPTHPLAHKALGDAYSKKSNYPKAIAAYGKAIEQDPDSSNAHNGLGMMYFSMGRYDLAAAEFRRAAELSPGSYIVRENLGLALYQLGQYQAAASELERALRSSPDSLKSHYSLARAYARLGSYERAIEHFRWVLDRAPQLAPVHAELGEVYAMLGLNEEAREEFRRALEIAPNSPQAMRGLERLGETGPRVVPPE